MIILQMSILAHVVSDFILQSDRLAELRYGKNNKELFLGNLIHGIIVFLTLVILLIPFAETDYNLLEFCITIAAGHFVIDLLKSCTGEGDTKAGLIVFFLDQAMHLCIIMYLWYSYELSSNYTWAENFLRNPKTEILINAVNININYELFNNIINFMIVYIYVTIGGDIVITKILNILRKNPEEKMLSDKIKFMFNTISNKFRVKYRELALQINQMHLIKSSKKKSHNGGHPLKEISATLEVAKPQSQNIKDEQIKENETDGAVKNPKGRYIGIIERTIILYLILGKQFTAITFLLTAKSIARYRQLEDKEFAEEYLIGTLSSILIAILGGGVLMLVMK